MNIAIIPARGGSKRIPRKNIKEFCGKPIIAYSIEVALQSGCFDRVIVSTDDQEIADIARFYDAETPFIRPEALSDDMTGTTPVIQHAITCLESQNEAAKLVCCIYATAPFIQMEDLQKGLDLLRNSDADYTFSVTSYPFPIQRAIKILNNQRTQMFYPEHFSTRSQDLEEAYHDAGQFYWGRVESWIEGKPIFTRQAIPVVLPRYRVQDIDRMEDWVRAELMFEAINKQKPKSGL